MPAHVDARPPRLDLMFRPGSSYSVRFTWPDGSLAGRTFTSTLGAAALTVTIDDDVMTVTVSAAVTAAAAAESTWLLLEDRGATDEAVMAGTWASSAQPAANVAEAVVVTDSTIEVEVTVLAAGPTVAEFDALETRVDALDAMHEDYTHVASGQPDRVRAVLAEAASRRVYVQGWGGSVTGGEPGASDPRSTSWLGLVGEALRDEYGDGGTGYLPLWFAETTGTWLDRVGLAAAEHRATAAATATWSDLAGTRVRIYYRNEGLTGSWRYRVDGGSWTTVTTPGGFGLDPARVEVDGLADTTHTVEVGWLSGTAGINGVECSRATGIVLQRCCIGGRGFSDYDSAPVRRAAISTTNTSTTITCTAPGHFTSSDVGRYLRHSAGGVLPADAQITAVASATSATISAAATATATPTVDFCGQEPSREQWPGKTRGNVFLLGLTEAGLAPDLVICGFGVNDVGGTSIEAAARGLDRVLGGADAAREVVIVSEHHAAFDDTAGFAVGLRALGLSVALAMGGAFVDMWGRGRHSFTYADDQGWLHDPVHLTDAGHEVVADILIPYLVENP